MLHSYNLKDILFLDIETVPQVEYFHQLDEIWQELWQHKSKIAYPNEKIHESYDKAGIFAEFGKIVCISVGIVAMNKNQELTLRLKSFFGHDEKKILIEFRELLQASYKGKYLCAHNGKEFDFPYIARRMLINGVKLPEALNIAGKKPWQINHLDTMELWKFGDYKSYTSLKQLTTIFNIPSPKDDIDGSRVKEVYYRENNLSRIAKYCEKDTVAVVQVFLKYRNQQIIKPENIISVTKNILEIE